MSDLLCDTPYHVEWGSGKIQLNDPGRESLERQIPNWQSTQKILFFLAAKYTVDLKYLYLRCTHLMQSCVINMYLPPGPGLEQI